MPTRHVLHWNINEHNTVQFDAKEWSRLFAEKKKAMDIRKIVVDYYDDDKLDINKIYKNEHRKDIS